MASYENTTIKKMNYNGQKVKKWYHDGVRVFTAGNVVTYYVNTDNIHTEEIDSEASCLSPTTFTPAISGWTFVGWREDAVASGEVLSSKVMGDEPISLYAVFKRTLTATFNGNGATSGSVASISGTQYYNNSNIANPTITLPANGYSRTDYTFTKWALGNTSGPQYSVGSSVTLSSNTVFYAMWAFSNITQNLRAAGNQSISPQYVYNWYSSARDLTNVSTITITYTYYYQNANSENGQSDAKYFYNCFDYIVGVSSNKSTFSASSSKTKVGYNTYTNTMTGTVTETLNVSSLRGSYYIGCATRGYNGNDMAGLVNYASSPYYYTNITNVTFA